MHRVIVAVVALAVLAGCAPEHDGGGGTEVSVAECSDTVDNDGDGLVDCADLACRLHAFCDGVMDGGSLDGTVAPDAHEGPADSGTQADAAEGPDAGELDAGQSDAGPDAGGTDAGGTDAGGTDAGGTDAGPVGRDAGMDGGPPIFDAGHDAGPVRRDAGMDGGPPRRDGGRDGGPVRRDAGMDGGPPIFDGGHDAGGDAGWDAGMEPAECPGALVSDAFDVEPLRSRPAGWIDGCMGGTSYDWRVRTRAAHSPRQALDMDFRGGSGEAAVGIPVAWPSSGQVTVSMWVRPETTTQNIYILAVRGNQRLFNAFPFTNTGVLQGTSTPYAANVWVHVVYEIDFDGRAYRMLADGVEINSGPFASMPVPCALAGGDYLSFHGGYVDQKWRAQVDDVVITAAQPVDLYGSAPCSGATLDCFDACGSSSCAIACIDADPAPIACNQCVNRNLIHCYNREGCQSMWDAWACCAEAYCPTSDPACWDAACDDEWTDYLTCTDGAPAGSCRSDFLECIDYQPYALSFDGSGDQLTLPADVGPATSAYTIEAWVRPTASEPGSSEGEGGMIFYHAVSGGSAILEWSGHVDRRVREHFAFRVYRPGGGWDIAVSPFASTVGAWHHVAGVLSNGTLRLYVDGSRVATATQSSPSSWQAASTIGNWAGRDGSDPRALRAAFDGEIDEIRISNTARYSAATITVPTRLAADPATIALWTLDEGSGTSASDLVGGFDGVVVNATWVPVVR